MPTPASPIPPQPELSATFAELYPEIAQRLSLAEQRLHWMERQWRLLLVDLGSRPENKGMVCMDSRCRAGDDGPSRWPGQVPHMAEQPDLCPILERP